jgi:hypothetical protein
MTTDAKGVLPSTMFYFTCPDCAKVFQGVPDASAMVTCPNGHRFAPIDPDLPPELRQKLLDGQTDRWKVLVKRLIYAALIAAVAFGHLGYLLWNDADDRERLRELKVKGKWTEGRVTAVESEQRSEQTISIAYPVDGQEYEGRWVATTFTRRLKVGDPISVFYHPDRPKDHRMSKVSEEDVQFTWGQFLDKTMHKGSWILIAIVIVPLALIAAAALACVALYRVVFGEPPVITSPITAGVMAARDCREGVSPSGAVGGGEPPPLPQRPRPAQRGDAVPSRSPIPESDPRLRGTEGKSVATVTIGRYVFVEEPRRLRILDSVGERPRN